ncbi:MAG: glycosyltransferase family 2 protein [Deltaproteobacteria bacterium]|nr:glycosyltransferase family 2 protein [Deltaproteobacteria bacterium]
MVDHNPPKVSVCIPTYNYAHYLPDAVGSVLAQTFPDYELVVVDNCSTDKTPDIVRKYIDSGAKIRYYRNERNVGQTGNFNLCLKYAAGDYIKILCADDLLEPACLEKLVSAMESHPRASLAGSARMLVNDSLRPLKVLSYSDRFVEDNGFNVIKRCLLKGNLIGEPTSVLFRKIHAERGFTTTYKQLIDLEMWFHLLEQGDFVFLPEPLSKFRRHEGQLTWEYIKDPAFFGDGWRIFNEYIDKDYVRMSAVRKSLLKVIRRGGMELLRRSHLARFAFSTLQAKVTARRHHV